MNTPTPTEQRLLEVVKSIGPADGMAIDEEYRSRYGKGLRIGRLYSSLHGLEQQGLVVGTWVWRPRSEEGQYAPTRRRLYEAKESAPVVDTEALSSPAIEARS